MPSIFHILDDFIIAQPPELSHYTTAICQVLTLFGERNIPQRRLSAPPSVLSLQVQHLTLSVKNARLPDDKLHNAR